jgi:hypothetical protein
LDAVPELSCGELSEAGHRSPESNLKREAARQTQIHFTSNATANATLELVEAALIADCCSCGKPIYAVPGLQGFEIKGTAIKRRA